MLDRTRVRTPRFPATGGNPRLEAGQVPRGPSTEPLGNMLMVVGQNVYPLVHQIIQGGTGKHMKKDVKQYVHVIKIVMLFIVILTVKALVNVVLREIGTKTSLG